MNTPRLQFELATPAWDERIERVAAEPVPGRIRVAYEHRPSFLASLSVLGDSCQTIVGHRAGKVAGVGVRAVRNQYLDGQPARLGYLGGLRIRTADRSGLVLARGYAFLRQLHELGPVPGYLTTVIATNSSARRLLESGRTGLPQYLDCGAYATCVLGGRRESTPTRPATPADLPAILALLRAAGIRRQGFPILAPEDLDTPRLAGLRIDDFLLAEQGGECLGCVAGWDQGSFRQHRVVGYGGTLRWLRPLANPFLALRGYPLLPRPGRAFSSLCASFLAVRDDDPRVAGLLVAALRDRVARERRDHLTIALHERDPLAPALRRLPAIRYDARLYAVAWDDPEGFARRFRAPHVPHLELGML